MNESGDGSTPLRHAIDLAEEIRRMGRKAASKGEEAHSMCEHFADHLINSVREMELRAGQNLEDNRVTIHIIRKVWAHFNMWVHESSHARDEKLGEDRLLDARTDGSGGSDPHA
jgi:hypothetical protein